MTDIKSQVQGLDPNVRARDIKEITQRSESIYESLAIIAKRARQISNDIKSELHHKLDEFAVTSDTIEEIHENKEQIEISKFYERLPNPVIIALEEYVNDGIKHRYRDEAEVKEAKAEN